MGFTDSDSEELPASPHLPPWIASLAAVAVGTVTDIPFDARDSAPSTHEQHGFPRGPPSLTAVRAAACVMSASSQRSWSEVWPPMSWVQEPLAQDASGSPQGCQDTTDARCQELLNVATPRLLGHQQGLKKHAQKAVKSSLFDSENSSQ